MPFGGLGLRGGVRGGRGPRGVWCDGVLPVLHVGAFEELPVHAGVYGLRVAMFAFSSLRTAGGDA